MPFMPCFLFLRGDLVTFERASALDAKPSTLHFINVELTQSSFAFQCNTACPGLVIAHSCQSPQGAWFPNSQAKQYL